VVWSEAINLSSSLESSDHPAVIADRFGNVHVFWSEEAEGKPIEPGQQHRNGNSIFHTRWDGASWSPPRDVLIVQGEDVAEFIAVTLDDENSLHLVWTGQTNIYYSSAPAWDADSPWAWSLPAVISNASARAGWDASIVVDAEGNLHSFYATRSNDPGVFHAVSRSGGAAWDAPVRLSLPLDALEVGFANVRAIRDGAGRLHVVWQTLMEQGYGQSIYYIRSTDGGDNWSAPLQMGYRDPDDYEASYPYLVSIAESALHLIYLDGPHRGRSHRISRDGGATWSDPLHILDELEGVNGYVVPLVDGEGGLHLIVNMRTRATQVVGVYYTTWLGDRWAPAVPVDVTPRSQHYTAAAVRLGNEIHIVYNEISPGEIWYMYGTLQDIPPLPALVPPSARSSAPTLPPTAAATASAIGAVTPVSPNLTPVPRANLNRTPPSDGGSNGAVQVILPGVGAALMVVFAAVAGITLRSRKRSLR
jgi:hypothetical protein